MRRFDKKKNITKVNLLSEQRYLATKNGISKINEMTTSLNTNMWKSLYDSNLFCDKHEIELIFEINTDESVNVLIDFWVRKEGEYSPATWGYHGGSDEEYPEAVLEINSISSNNYTLTDEDKENIISHHQKFIIDEYLNNCKRDEEI